MAYVFIYSCLWQLWSHGEWWMLVTQTVCGPQSMTCLLSGSFQNKFAAFWPKIPFLYLIVIGFGFLSFSSSLPLSVFFFFFMQVFGAAPQRAFLVSGVVFLFCHHIFGIVWIVSVPKDPPGHIVPKCRAFKRWGEGYLSQGKDGFEGDCSTMISMSFFSGH